MFFVLKTSKIVPIIEISTKSAKNLMTLDKNASRNDMKLALFQTFFMQESPVTFFEYF